MSPAESTTYSVKQLRDARLEDIERRQVAKMEDEYKDEIAAHQRAMELTTVPDVNMMDLQPELEWHMRPYLLDFLVESHLSLRLQPQTLFLAVNLIDRYCSRRVVFKKHYQLVGCAALWIAAKYEDKKDRVPTVRELKVMCCDAYEEDMFVQMEGHVLSTLEWTIGHPTVDTFLRQILRCNCYPSLEHLALYLCEISLFHKSFLGFTPSVIASAAHIVAQHILMNRTSVFTPVSAATSPDVAHCVSLLSQYILHPPSQSLQKKYSSSSFSQVALILQDFVVRQQHSISTLPPTPPPSSESPVPQQLDQNVVMVDVSSFRESAAYITPPCSPDEPCPEGYQQLPTPC
ncbi:cyclin-like protein [Lipomyces chichibuensis]|uniref:cyclin-like protein n=1 Tax=Lipomyces chichibuensis TaxID=1546026 RepID=UPI0033434025